MNKKSKHYDIDEDVLHIIQKVKEEQGLKTEVAALSYIVRKHEDVKEDTISQKQMEELADIFLQKYSEQYYKFFDRLRWATQTAEMNSIIMKDVLNTLLIRDRIEYCMLTDIETSPVIQTSMEYQKNKIEHFKQKKDDRNARKKGANL